ncbi:FtsH-binding integral membrane protein [Nocardiopsis terrae]|uniref:FtsH-binding integral membrane protein n=1 Tax=Nocardiopsis terrae TaxID=372655 RepID=A0ABR9HCF6_9ACTN|nr:hypothetical protein [Nocardiopsis terrae]MBE1456711.1 FtsH-binding integral membrane protein [Nocardiopsis terrae]
MQDTQTSPVSSAPRPFSVVPAPRQSILAVRHPGVRPPQDVRQTCVLMFVAAAGYVLLAYQSWAMLDAGAPGPVVSDLRFLLVLAALVALGMAVLALPVRRAGHVLWRSAQFGALVALGTAVSALYTAAKLADTPMLAVGLLVILFAIIVNIALWSTSVRRWCGL